ncbi:MAG: phosphoadenylyl-sulfate reductase [Mariprofundaceae bacterium]|nr:phosphoadenylyl-sulfate reductase [Mariprofundaceae bacterium]
MSALVEQAVDLLKLAKKTHGDGLAYPCSMGLEGSVMVDLISRHDLDIPIMTLDTGRLPQATYDTISALEDHYRIKIRILFPDCREVEAMVHEYGVNLFRKSVELRKSCCEIRKVRPLMRALEGKEAWITGRRRQQSKGRSDLHFIETDPVYGLKKYNPLLEWSLTDVSEYVRANDVPYNRLHDVHYQSIGCECCTRAISMGEDERAGRWWWENDDGAAECGLHVMSLKEVSGDIEDGEGI